MQLYILGKPGLKDMSVFLVHLSAGPYPRGEFLTGNTLVRLNVALASRLYH